MEVEVISWKVYINMEFCFGIVGLKKEENISIFLPYSSFIVIGSMEHPKVQ
jgi:hypothetical protein